jgi:ferritin-like metal-binding protein YciE
MSGTNAIGQELYKTGLRNQHAVENQALELMERQVGRLENYPEVAARIRQHIEETREQAQRLEQLLADLGSSPSTVKDTFMSAVGNMMALMHAPAPDEIVKNTLANFAFEHYEIASYRALLVMAELAGHTAAIGPLKQSLAEEQAMADWISQNMAGAIRKFFARSEAGDTAGR